MDELRDRIRVVLVQPENPINIGTVVRAMMNMGMSSLYLVAPAPMDPAAVGISAHHSEEFVDGIVTVRSLEEALDGVSASYGFTARNRAATWTSLDVGSAAGAAVGAASAGRVSAYVFGRERTGLTNAELMMCGSRVYIPTSGYSSLNLAQAVLLSLYETNRRIQGDGYAGGYHDGSAREPVFDNYAPGSVPADQGMVHRLLCRIESALIETGYYKSSAPNGALHRIRNVLERARLHDDEIHLLMGVFGEVGNYANLIARGIYPEKFVPDNSPLKRE